MNNFYYRASYLIEAIGFSVAAFSAGQVDLQTACVVAFGSYGVASLLGFFGECHDRHG